MGNGSSMADGRWARWLGRRSAKGMAWLGMAVAAGLLAARLASPPEQSAFERAQARAVQAVEMELAATASYGELAKAMTPEAAKQALADRTASGLERALAESRSAINAKATPMAVERTVAGWSVRGSAAATWQAGSGAAGQTVPWTGEWTAALVLDGAGDLKVSKLTVSSKNEDLGQATP